jgi:hypothetical protein
MTAQVADKLIYEGKQIMLFSNPLSLYLRQNKIQFESPHTANWRGYLATWEIKEFDGVERLYLTKLHAHRTYEDIVGVKDLFPGYKTVFAHWFTGELRCPQGDLVEYVHMGYGSSYEYELFIEFKQGILINKFAKHVEQPARGKK